jgi:diaminopimelate epimerase
LASNPITLVKAHAYGNDFLIVRGRSACRRRYRDGRSGYATGTAASGPARLIIEADSAGARMRCSMRTAATGISSNGVRCVAAWLARLGGDGPGAEFTVDTEAGPKALRFLRQEGSQLTFLADMGPPAELREVELEVAGTPVRAAVLRVGNPQCVVLGPATLDRLQTLGAGLATHPFFPEGTNVELAEVIGPEEVRILIWERGVGPTESSGTGACAAAVAAAAFGGADRSVDVVSPGGRQHVEWTADGLRLTGWAEVLGEFEWWAG